MVERRENINQVATQIQSLLQRSGLSMTEVRKIAHDMKDLYENHDYEYICAVLFPASSPPARIPERFGLQSALFTHRFKFYVNTGVSGSGFVSFLPQDVTYKCVYKSDPAAQYTGNQGNGRLTNVAQVLESDSTFISTSFAQARLVGAEMKVQFIGIAQNESGFMVGSHVEESTTFQMSDEIIENGFFVARGRPSEGIRLVYLPKDNADLEYVDSSFIIQTQPTVAGIDASTDFFVPNNSKAVVKVFNNGAFEDMVDAGGVRIQTPADYWGQGAKRHQSKSVPQLAFYWKGLIAGQDWFRVDVERHFEGIPRTSIRDIVATQKPKPNETSIQAIQELSKAPELFGSTADIAPAMKQGFMSKMADIVTSVASKTGEVAVNRGLDMITSKLNNVFANKNVSTSNPYGGSGIGDNPIRQGIMWQDNGRNGPPAIGY